MPLLDDQSSSTFVSGRQQEGLRGTARLNFIGFGKGIRLQFLARDPRRFEWMSGVEAGTRIKELNLTRRLGGRE